ncbi:MAG: diacylglycerol kinase family protein [Candidatus Levybacteria bacterium]|nr:diacylglycerol kinase family protein [Candidatus Levybacteria bacterium]
MSQTNYSFKQSLGFAINGIKIATKYNRNIRIHFIIAILVFLSCFILKMPLSDVAIIGMIILLVISVEIINTAIEEIVDLVTKDYKEEAKIAKDVSAGMVLIVAVGSIAVGILVFTPHVLRFIFPS